MYSKTFQILIAECKIGFDYPDPLSLVYLIPASLIMYARIIYTLGHREISSGQGDKKVVDVKKQVTVMLIINGVVFFLLHVTVSSVFAI